MKKFNALNLGKGLNRSEMKTVIGGLVAKCSFSIGSQYYDGVNESTKDYICANYNCTGISCS